jgi:bifunctional protein folC
MSEADPRGIDPELYEYLEAAQELDEISVAEAARREQSAQAAQAAAEEEDGQAIRALVEGSLLAGSGDLDEVLLGLEGDVDADWEGQADEPSHSHQGEGQPGEADSHRQALARAAYEQGVRERLAQVEAEILARAPEHKVQPSLERVELALDYLGNPQKTFKAVHITGTNGKTSTSRMVERLAAATGMRTGRFTSPHLHTIRERIALDGEPISAEGFIAAWEDVAPVIELVDAHSAKNGGPRMSFFEVLTVMAYAVFADYPVDVAIVEVGMGGRWDATNVLDQATAVITPIGRDHERWLGSTIGEIAYEKSGIIKPGATVIAAAQPEEAQAQILQAVADNRALLRQDVSGYVSFDARVDLEAESLARENGGLAVASRQFAVGGQMLTLVTAAAVYQDVFLPLHGQYQAHNALLALAAAESLFGGRALPAQIVENAFAQVTSPGRLEVVRTSPTVLVDAAHNPHGVSALRTALEESFPLKHLVLVYAAMADKDVEGVLSELEPICEAVVCVPMDSPRAMELDDLVEIADDVFGSDRVRSATNLVDAVDLAAQLAESSDDPLPASGVLILGSVVLAAQARELFGLKK